jgi:hypothetical protein
MAGRISKLKEQDIGLLGMNEALNVVRLCFVFSFCYPRVSLGRDYVGHFMGIKHLFIFSQIR